MMSPSRPTQVISVLLLGLLGSAACESGAVNPTGGAGARGGGNPAGGGGASGTGTGGVAGGTGVGGAGTGGAGTTTPPPPATCSEAARPYTVSAVTLDATLVPSAAPSGGNSAELPVAVDPATGQVYVGFTRTEGTSRSAVIATSGGTPIVLAGAVNAGIAVTKDGFAVLLFDPNTSVDMRTWAAVKRLRKDGTELWSRDMFRSPNLTDVGTKGAPATSRLAYLPATDEIYAYFAHTQRYDDGVRHQGGFVGKMVPAGTLEVLNAWWGSHNLDQRLLVRSGAVTLLGLGDAYPEGIFFGNAAPRMRTTVIHPLASAGNGATNGQLGGMVDLDDIVLIPFITNKTVPQDLDAGTWPDIDEAIATQIRQAAGNGTDLGLLRLTPSATIPATGLAAVWTDPQRTTTSRLERLKSARYGTGPLALLAFAEATGTGRSATRNFFTMVVDREGAVCQAKTPLDARYAPTAGDDFVRAPDGRIIWANPQGTAIQIVTLTPG